MIAPAGMQFPMYYPPNPHGGPVMMRYPPPPPDMMPPMGPNGMMMHQRPMGMDPMMHYPTGSRESGPSEGKDPKDKKAFSEDKLPLLLC